MNPNDPNLEGSVNQPIEPIPIDTQPTRDIPPFIESDAEFIKKEYKEKVEKIEVEQKIKEESSNGMEVVIEYIKENKGSLITYLFLLVSLLFLILADFFLGSLILGLTAGYHFSYEIVFYLRNLSHLFEGHEHLRFIVLTAVIIGLILSIPGMFIGAIVAAVFKYVIYDKKE